MEIKTRWIGKLRELANQGVKFFFFAGANGSGKDLQANLTEEVMLPFRLIAHVSTSDAIKHHMNDQSDLGTTLQQESRRLDQGVLFSDKPTLQAVTLDVEALQKRHNFRIYLLSGIPRGVAQPEIVAQVRNCQFISFEVTKTTCVKRAIARSKQRKQQGLPPRQDDSPPTAIKRWKEHVNECVPAMKAAAGRYGVTLSFIDGNQPVKAVLRDTLKAMQVTPHMIDECLFHFENRKGSIPRIMEGVQEQILIPPHWPVSRKIAAVKAATEETLETLRAPAHSSTTTTHHQPGRWQVFHAEKSHLVSLAAIRATAATS